MITKNYYKILQVDPSAEPEVIEGARNRLVKKYHPDVNKSPEATHRMQEINEAYSVLSNPAEREKYDREQGFQVGQKSTWEEEIERHRRDAEQKKRAEEEIRRHTEYQRQQRDAEQKKREQEEKRHCAEYEQQLKEQQESPRKRELAPKLCKKYLAANPAERHLLVSEVVSLGIVTIETLIEYLCVEALAINHELFPRNKEVDETALLNNEEMQNRYVWQQMERLFPEARPRLEDKVIAVSEVLVKLAKTDNSQDLDQLIRSIGNDNLSQKWIMVILLYYSAKTLGGKIIKWQKYIKADPTMSKTLEQLTLATMVTLTAADAGDLEQQEARTLLIKMGVNKSKQNDKNALNEHYAEIVKTNLGDAYAEFVRSRNPKRYIYKLWD